MSRLDHPPHESFISRAAAIIETNYPQRDALGICIDLCADGILVCETTPTIAQMFQDQNSALPEHWRNNTEIWRTILTMTANADLGFVKARIKHESRDGQNEQLTQKAENLQRFIGALEEQVGQGLGEMGGRKQTRK